MKTLSDLLKNKSTANNTQISYAELLKKRKEDNEAFICELASNKGKSRLESLMGRSGILPLHQKCTINNYIATTTEQKHAKQFAYHYILDFAKNDGMGFVFSGNSGTGKNHLSAAICNKLISDGKSCMITTISELMIKMRKCYGNNPDYGEDEFIQSLVKFDLLVLDEIGLQRGTDNEKLVLNQVIDQRISRFKPTGMITNLNAEDVNKLLGVRIMDRMRMNGGEWIPFTWGSYRK